MNDAELTRAVAEKVMGWDAEFLGAIGRDGSQWVMHPYNRWFGPLRVDSDSADLLDTLAGKYDIRLAADPFDKRAGWDFEIYNGNIPMGHCYTTELTPENRRRCLVIAALRAVGVEVDG